MKSMVGITIIIYLLQINYLVSKFQTRFLTNRFHIVNEKCLWFLQYLSNTKIKYSSIFYEKRIWYKYRYTFHQYFVKTFFNFKLEYQGKMTIAMRLQSPVPVIIIVHTILRYIVMSYLSGKTYCRRNNGVKKNYHSYRFVITYYIFIFCVGRNNNNNRRSDDTREPWIFETRGVI